MSNKSPTDATAYTPVSDQSSKNTLSEPKQSNKSSRGSKHSSSKDANYSPSQKTSRASQVSNSTSKNTSPRESVKTKRSIDNKLPLCNLNKDDKDMKTFLNQQPIEDPEEEERAALAAAQTIKDKKVARAVMVVAGVLLVMCFILVGATLSLSDHIDALVIQKKKDLFKSWDSSNNAANETLSEET